MAERVQNDETIVKAMLLASHWKMLPGSLGSVCEMALPVKACFVFRSLAVRCNRDFVSNHQAVKANSVGKDNRSTSVL